MTTSGDPSCFPNGPQPPNKYSTHEYQEDASVSSSLASPNSLLYNLSLLKTKLHQLESLVTTTVFISPENHQFTAPTVGNLVQEIIAIASAFLVSSQQIKNHPFPEERAIQGDLYTGETLNDDHNQVLEQILVEKNELGLEKGYFHPDIYDIIELNASDLLAKYTHYCHVCGKGFKRDANLRMHMRAHGEEYKSRAALTNPTKDSIRGTGSGQGLGPGPMRKYYYSCPQEGCKWNRLHARFQPLKSMVCAKNHYRRSHCPKMYVCRRCNQKQFSVVSDLRTHEKHCGNQRWRCTCGTTFSRKDKLMGHVGLFVGHSPAVVDCLLKKKGEAGDQVHGG